MVCLGTGAAVGRIRRGSRAELDLIEGAGACRFLESLVSGAFGIGRRELRSDGRGRASVAYARHAAMYLAHVCLGMRLSDVARHFGRDRTTVAYACARVEDKRENPRVDRVLACLESALYRWRNAVASEDTA